MAATSSSWKIDAIGRGASNERLNAEDMRRLDSVKYLLGRAVAGMRPLYQDQPRGVPCGKGRGRWSDTNQRLALAWAKRREGGHGGDLVGRGRGPRDGFIWRGSGGYPAQRAGESDAGLFAAPTAWSQGGSRTGQGPSWAMACRDGLAVLFAGALARGEVRGAAERHQRFDADRPGDFARLGEPGGMTGPGLWGHVGEGGAATVRQKAERAAHQGRICPRRSGRSGPTSSPPREWSARRLSTHGAVATADGDGVEGQMRSCPASGSCRSGGGRAARRQWP